MVSKTRSQKLFHFSHVWSRNIKIPKLARTVKFSLDQFASEASKLGKHIVPLFDHNLGVVVIAADFLPKQSKPNFSGLAAMAMPDLGGAWVPDTGGEGDDDSGKGHPPPGVIDMLEKFGQKGIVISGIVTWIEAQIDSQTSDAWRSLAVRCFLDGEVTAAKEALKSAKGIVLENLLTDFKTKRQGASKKAKEIDDIRDAIVALQAAGEMPLVMASSKQMVRCPQSWGVPPAATVQDVMGRVIMLEKVMADNMQNQKEHMELLKQEMLATRKPEPRTPFRGLTPSAPPFLPEVMVTEDTPNKKRKLGETQSQMGMKQPPSYAGITMEGVHPLEIQQQKGIKIS